MDGSRDVTFCNRWERPELFSPPKEILHDPACMLHSIAGYLNFIASNVHDYIMSSDVSKWIKIPAMLLLDAALLTLPIIALTETSLRLALGIITLPLLLGKFCSENRWFNASISIIETACASLAEAPNTAVTIYNTLTSVQTFDPHQSRDAILVPFLNNLKHQDILLSLASCLNLIFANLMNTVNGSGQSKWIKTPCILILNLLNLATVPFIAIAETALRLALIIITSPLLLLAFCTNFSWNEPVVWLGATMVYSLCQIPNSFASTYLSHTSTKIDSKHIGRDITKTVSCGTIH